MDILRSKFYINRNDTNKQPPDIHCQPKLHKTPSKTKIIVSAAHYFLKQLSKAASLISLGAYLIYFSVKGK